MMDPIVGLCGRNFAPVRTMRDRKARASAESPLATQSTGNIPQL